MAEPWNYPWIQKWGELLRWPAAHIHEQILRAQVEHAPYNAIYKEPYVSATGHRWFTIHDIIDPVTRVKLGLEPTQPKKAEKV